MRALDRLSTDRMMGQRLFARSLCARLRRCGVYWPERGRGRRSGGVVEWWSKAGLERWRIGQILILLGCLMLLPLTRVQGAGCSPAVSGLVAWWPGDGSAVDIVGTNNGVLQGGASASASGFVGSAFSFDGTNSFVAISNSATLRPTNFTIEAWVRFSGLDSQGSGGSPAGDQYIVFKQNTRGGDFEGIDLSKTRVGTNDVFRFEITSATAVTAEIHSSTVIATGVWYHVAVVRGTNFTQIFVNGQLQGQSNGVTFAQDYGTLPLYFGTSGQSFWDHKFKGSLDEVSMYSRPLSSNEIAAIYAAGASGKCKAVNITSQPQGQTNVAIGSTVTFSVAATGLSPLSYQWRLNGTNLSAGTASSFVITNLQPANGGNYSVVITNTLSAATSDVAVLTVGIPPSISSQPQSQTNIVGSNVTFSVVASGSPAPAFQWRFNSGNLNNATNSSLTLTAIQTSDQGSYTVVASNSAGSITSAFATLTVWVPPSITLQPQSQTNIIGSNVTFTASASGTPGPGYQWQFNGNSIPGATSSTLPLAGIQTSDGGSYSVVASNAASSITSAVATLTVWVPPSISLQPQSQTNIIGSNVTFSATAAGTPAPGYQWQFNGNSISGATASTLSLTGIQSSDGGSYSVVASNAVGSITSAVATLTVWIPPSISLQPQSQTNIIGSNVTFTASAAGTPAPGYQWQFNGSPISAGTSSRLTLNGIQPSDGGSYTVVASNAAGSITSAVATLTVWIPPSISLQPQSQTNIIGSNVTFTASASGTPGPGYQWQFNGNSISGATGSTLPLTAIRVSDGGSYSVVASNAAGSITSAVATLTVWVPPSISLQPQSQTNIIGSNVTFIASASGTPGAGYQWQFNGNSISGATGSTLPLNGIQPSDAGSYTIVASNAAGSITSAVATLTIWVPPSISLQPQSQTNIIGSNVTFTATAVGTPAPAYQWQFNGSPISAGTSSSLTLNSIQPSDGGSYTVVASNAAGSITSSVATLTVWIPPSISLQPQSQTNIIGSNVTFTATAVGTPGPRYQWQFNGSPISAGTSSRLTLNGIQPSDAGSYSVTASNAAGSITSSVATLTVWIPPSISLQPQSQTNIIGSNVTFSVTGSGTPAVGYQWQFNGSAISGATASSLPFSSIQPSNGGNYNVIVSNAAGSVTSAVATLTVWVPPSISAQPQSLTNITGSIATFSVQGAGAPALAYQWQFNGTNLGGATGSSYSIAPVQLSRAGTYRVILTNSAGVVTSSPATLLVIEGVGFCDLNLEDAIRAQLGKPAGIITTLDMQSIRTLIVPDSHIGSLCGLERASNLVTLNLGNNLISDITVFTNLFRLTNLFLYHNLLTNIAPLIGLSNLTSLDLRNNPATTSFSPVSTLTNLTALYLGGNSLTDLTAVQNLSKLATLDLDNNSLTNLAALQALTNLTTLDIGYNAGVNAQQLSGLASLRSLYLSGIAVTNVDFLQGLSGLTNLCLHGNPLADISSLASLNALRSLEISANVALPSFDPLAALTNLQTLRLHDNLLNSILFLQPLSNLSFLDAHGNLIADLSPLAALSGLTTLNLANNLATNTASLSGLTNLANLALGANSISNLVLPQAAWNLVSLSVFGDGLTSVPSLAAYTNLATLDLGANPLTNVSSVGLCTNLSNLSLYGNSLSNIAFLAPLWRLLSLDLHGNSIGAIGTLASLSNLAKLNLSGNVVTDPTVISGLPNLFSLDLSANPLGVWNFSSTNLAVLAVRGTFLTNLAFVQNLPLLSWLDITANRCTNAAALSSLTNLHSLLAGNNRLSDLAGLNSLPRLWNADMRTNLIDLSSPAQGSAIQSLTNRLVALALSPQNQRPTLSLPGYIAISANATSAPLALTVSDDVTPVGQLQITASSSNGALIPDANIIKTFTNDSWWLQFFPLPGQSGKSQISVSVTDDTSLTTNSILTVEVVAPQPVSIPDPRLLGAIRIALNNPSGTLYNVDMLNLSLLAAESFGITNISGLEWATNLTYLFLNDNSIRSIQPLHDLRGLSRLYFDNNLIGDFSAVAGLTNLTQFSAGGNSISNLLFTQNLTRLSALGLSNNRIADLSSISALPNLATLLLDQNLLSGLQTLPQPLSLSYVNVAWNKLDITPGSAPRQVITNLQARGVTVVYSPQRTPPTILAPDNWLISQGNPSMLQVTLSESIPPSTPYTYAAGPTNSTLLPGVFLTNDPVLGLTVFAVPASNQNGSTTLGLTVRDSAGLSTTSSVLVTVIAQPLAVQLFGKSNLVWSSFGDAFWFGQTAVTHSGVSAAQSGHIGNSRESSLQTSVVGPGQLSFWWKVSSEFTFDFLEFYIDGVLQTNRLSGTNGDWQQQIYGIPAGPNTLVWRYVKDDSVSIGADAGWLDQVAFTPGFWLEIGAGTATNQINLILHGGIGRPYQVQTSTNLLNWTPLGIVTLTNNSTIFIDTAATNRTKFYRMQDLQTSIWFDPPVKTSGGMRLVLHSAPDLEFQIQASTDLTTWTSIGTVTNFSGTVQITDAGATNRQMRMYRAALTL